MLDMVFIETLSVWWWWASN